MSKTLKAKGRVRRVSLWLAAAIIAAAGPAAAEQKKTVPKTQPQAHQQPQAPAPALPPIPDAYALNLMIRSSIIALNQANKTGNYTVLQDLAAPAFRASNNSARLAQIFAHLRQRNLDLTPILFFTPKLAIQPQINPQGILRLAGHFPTAPERVDFDLYFQVVGGEWRLFGIGVTTSPAEVTAATQPQPQSQQNPVRANAPAEGSVASGPPSGSDPAANASPHTAPAKVAAQAEPAPPPSRKPARAGGAETTAATQSTVRNGTTTNATRIDLANPQFVASDALGENAPAQGTNAGEKSESKSGFWDSLNIFSNK